MDFGLGGLFSGIGNIAGSWINAQSQKDTNKQNERLMREGWAREDMATQRRAADLEAAGLSKTLAAGSAAQSGSPVKLEAPQWGDVAKNTGNIPMQMLDAIQMKKNIEVTNEQKKLVKEQAAQKQIENIYLSENLKNRNWINSIKAEYAGAVANLQMGKVRSEIEKNGRQAVNISADTELKKSNLNENLVDIQIKKVAAAIAEATKMQEIEKKDVELALKKYIANNTAVQAAMKKHDYDLFAAMGLPTTTSYNDPMKIGGLIGSILSGNATGSNGYNFPYR